MGNVELDEDIWRILTLVVWSDLKEFWTFLYGVGGGESVGKDYTGSSSNKKKRQKI